MEVFRYHAVGDGLYLVSTEKVLKGFLSKINKIIFQNLPSWAQSSWLKLLPPIDNCKVSIKLENALKTILAHQARNGLSFQPPPKWMHRYWYLIHHILDLSEHFQATTFSNQWILLAESDANHKSLYPFPVRLLASIRLFPHDLQSSIYSGIQRILRY